MLKTFNTPQLKTLALAICLAATTTSVYADKDRNKNHRDNDRNGSHYESNHNNHNDSHDGNHDGNHGDRDGSSSNQRGSKLRAYLNGVTESQATGKMKYEVKSSKTEFGAEVKIPVPSAALEVSNTSDANFATMSLVLSDGSGQAYAICDLDFHKIKTDKYSGVRVAEYKVEISNRNGYLQEKEGVCDINLNASGIQAGVPAPQAGDYAEITIDTNDAVVVTGGF